MGAHLRRSPEAIGRLVAGDSLTARTIRIMLALKYPWRRHHEARSGRHAALDSGGCALLGERRIPGGGHKEGRWPRLGADTAYGKLFDPKTVENLKGKVLSVERFTPLRQMGYGLLVVLETSAETINVHVGPGWFVAEQDFELSAGDEITVRGSRITFQDVPAVIAVEVRKGQRILKLRQDNGLPVWSEDEGG
ncbi:MAG: hypothetical protein ACUVS3_12490 [Thermodesulfobacteriota bacterium]